MEVCTIIAKNYVGYARVLARSLAEHNPGARLWTLIIDELESYIDPAHEPFEVLTPADIDCEPFAHMAIRYSVLELSTAVKPWLLRHLMERTDGPITYLDPDIRIYGSLAPLEELARQHGVVLTPHNNEPIPADGRKPSQVDIMIAGVYNLGYVSLAPGPEVDRLLDWWSERLRRDCRVDPIWGYFVDQRWFDLAPGFLTDLAIVREPEYNVAYWNLHSRRLGYEDGRYTANGTPLAFFHFSGFDPEHPLVLSRHQNRIDVAGDRILERILSGYADEVMQAGHADSRDWPYSYASLANGLQADDTLRDLYDSFVDASEANGGVASPFTPGGARVFVDWLTEQAPGAPPGVNRILAHLHERRADVREAYPDLSGGGSVGLLEWAQQHGTKEVPLLAFAMGASAGKPQPALKAPPAAPAAFGSSEEVPRPGEGSVSPLHDDPWGVNVVGYFRSELGTGEAARQVVAALDSGGVPVLPIHGRTIPLNRQGHTYETAAPDDAPFPVNLICMNADMLPEFAAQVGDPFFSGRYSIGLWFWEVSSFPERWHGSFSLLEEVWAPTAHVAAALEPVATVPVHTARIPVSPAPFELRSRAALGVPEGKFVFLFNFDYLSVFRRKNPIAVVNAFKRAFAPGDGAALVLKSINSERDPDAHAQLREAVAGRTDIEVLDRYMSPSDNLALTALCDSYVSLHRAEGLGLVMAEAMWLGKPVIATGYSGNLDFMNAGNSLLVDHTLVPIGPGAEPYPAEGEWAEPDVEHAASLMRRCFDDRDAAVALGARASAEIRRTHSAEAAGQLMQRRLESIRATGEVRRGADVVPQAVSGLASRIRRGPSAPGTGGRAPGRGFARRSLLRAMRPFTAYQQAVNLDVVAAMDELRTSLAEARSASARERARLLAELRRYEQLPSLVQTQARTIEQMKHQLAEPREPLDGPADGD